MPPNSQTEAINKKGVGTILLYPISQASRIAYGTDKTIAHTSFDHIWKSYYMNMTKIHQRRGTIAIIFVPFQTLREFER